ncbi:MAG TPA: hypothetical protein ENN08_04745, partial [Bacteroidales bacterium]|nr:hypothetical protein [Bacteroidales bacterium]
MKSKLYLIAIFSILLLGGTSCMTQKPHYSGAYINWEQAAAPAQADTLYSVILVGDARRIYQYPVLHKVLQNHLDEAGENSMVLFIGDNAHPKGLPDSAHKNWEIASQSLISQLELLENFKGKPLFIPGNHDWAQGRKHGMKYMRNQQEFIADWLGHNEAFLPLDGTPGPVEIALTEDIALIVIDSHWWFHPYEKSYEGIEDEQDFFMQIDDAVKRNSHKNIIFAAHHPLYSAGLHGGHFPLKSNLFPLTEKYPNLYIPLPGFIYTGYRKFLGSLSDLPHPHYKVYKEALLDAFEGMENLIFVGGHDHNLQFVSKPDLHHIISGSAGGAQYVAHNKKTDYAQAREGFARLTFLANGDVWLDFLVEPDAGKNNSPETEMYGKVSFREKLFNKPVFDPEEHRELLETIDYSDSTVKVHPEGEIFSAGRVKKMMMGANYRQEWVTPVEVPVFNFQSQGGELKILQRGGGGQTRSLRLEDENGRHYVLRSIDKDPSVSIPEIIRVGFAEDLVMDQMSASLPWAPLSLPRLAQAANIYHTNPQIVYLADDPRLGPYRQDYANAMYLFEERPAGDREDVDSFGNSENIRSTSKMMEKLEGNPKNRVDQEMFLRARLVDMLVSDWDRHADQWRWARFREGDLNVYRPVPRDRDMAFYVNEGLLPWLSSRKFLFRKTQGLDYDIKDIAGLNYQGVHLDRRFLNELTLNEWIETATWLQLQISDQVIEDAVNDMPPQITEINGELIAAKLKSRRDKLVDFAREYYFILAKDAEVIGTYRDDHFLVEQHGPDSTTVSIFQLDKKEGKEEAWFSRTYFASETREIRLYGLGGDDVFELNGQTFEGIKIRMATGDGKNRVVSTGGAGGSASGVKVYAAQKKKNSILDSQSLSLPVKYSEDYIYKFDVFKYNTFIPFPIAGYNIDDGLHFGAGFHYTTHGFMKHPFASRHLFDVNWASSIGAFELNYEGLFRDAIGNLDFNLHATFRDPKYTLNYFGPGNETEKYSSEQDYHRVRIGELMVNPALAISIAEPGYLWAGMFYQTLSVENTEGRFISDFLVNELDADIFSRKHYTGINAGFSWDSRNEEVFPARGILFNATSSMYTGLHEGGNTFGKLSSDLSIFMAFRKPYRTVLAFRFGGEKNFGDHEFYHAASLGGRTNLRGFRDTRYAGDASLYQNTEIRFKISKIKTYMARGSFGLLAFNDLGRVWLDGEHSSKWHHGYG